MQSDLAEVVARFLGCTTAEVYDRGGPSVLATTLILISWRFFKANTVQLSLETNNRQVQISLLITKRRAR